MRSSRDILCTLIETYDHRYQFKRTGTEDTRPEGVWIKYLPPKNGQEKAYYCEGRIMIYREGVDPESIEPSALAADAADPTSELVYLVHELGHHHSDLLAGKHEQFDKARPKETFVQEVRAWEIGKRLLVSHEFGEWNSFHAIERQRLEEYRVGLNLTVEVASEIERMTRHGLASVAPAV
jgi:hypothetical protein